MIIEVEILIKIYVGKLIIILKKVLHQYIQKKSRTNAKNIFILFMFFRKVQTSNKTRG